jgi:hypothetical protein
MKSLYLDQCLQSLYHCLTNSTGDVCNYYVSLIGFLAKSLPSNFIVDLIVAIQYGIMIAITLASFIHWQIAILGGIIYFLWHFFLVYIRKVSLINKNMLKDIKILHCNRTSLCRKNWNLFRFLYLVFRHSLVQ